ARKHQGYPVVDAAGRLVGVLTRSSLLGPGGPGSGEAEEGAAEPDAVTAGGPGEGEPGTAVPWGAWRGVAGRGGEAGGGGAPGGGAGGPAAAGGDRDAQRPAQAARPGRRGGVEARAVLPPGGPGRGGGGRPGLTGAGERPRDLLGWGRTRKP